MNYLQLITIVIYNYMPYWTNDKSSESHLMVASPSGTSFFGTRLMVGSGGHSIKQPLFLSVLKGLWTWDYQFHLCVDHSLLGIQYNTDCL